MTLFLIIKAYFNVFRRGFKYLVPKEGRYKSVVECYPDKISGRTPEDMFPKMRGFLVNDLSKCTGCGECIDLCAVKALKMETKARVDGSLEVNDFKIDLGLCYSCSICVDICPVGSIAYTSEYEGVESAREKLVLEFSQANLEVKDPAQQIRTYEFRWK